jgi:hypothetical protein
MHGQFVVLTLTVLSLFVLVHVGACQEHSVHQGSSIFDRAHGACVALLATPVVLGVVVVALSMPTFIGKS